MLRKLKVTHFKPSGKFYNEEVFEMEIDEKRMFALTDQYRAKVAKDGHAPGLSTDGFHFITVLTPVDDFGWPFLIPADSEQ